MSYRTLLAAVAVHAKRQGVADLALRYNPLVRLRVARTIQRFERADLDGRRLLSRQLTARAIAAARRSTYGRAFADHYDDWPLLKKDMVRDDPSAFFRHKILKAPAATGGTSGTPLLLQRSTELVAAEQTFLDRLLGPGGPPWSTARIAILRGDQVKDPQDQRPPFGIQTHFGRRMLLSGVHLAPKNFSWYIDALRCFRPQVLVAYPNQAMNLLHLLEQTGERIQFDAVITTSEVLTPDLRAALARDLGAQVYDHYGQAERVCLATSACDQTYHFDPAYGRVELIPADWYDAGEGRKAVSIVGTAFWNDAMPLVRYDTGDLAIVPATAGLEEYEQIALGLKPFLGIAGRADEFVLTPDGLRICGLNQIPREVANLLQVQIVQESLDRIIVRAVTRQAFNATDQARLLANIRAKIPPSMTFSLEPTECLVRTPAGKAPFVIRRLS